MSSALQYALAVEDGEECLTVFLGDKPRIVRSDSPRFEEILAKTRAGDASVADLFDLAETLGKQFERLSERVTARNGRLYLDGDELATPLAETALKFHQEGEEGSLAALVNFFEKVQTNTDQHSRDQLYTWVTRQNITITPDGDLVAYKGVASDGKGGYRSTHSGYAIRNGEEVTDYVPNAVGDLIEMPRSRVRNDPNTACSVGLHIGSFNYAKSYGRNGAMLEVHVNPRDFVSVPRDGAGEKARVCRYKVAGIVQEEYKARVLPAPPAEPQKAAQKPSGASKAKAEPLDLSKAVTPGKPRFEELAATAKSQKKGVKALAEKQGWVLVGDDPKDRKSWKAPKAPRKR